MRHALTLSAKRFSIPILAPSQPEVLKGFRNIYEESNGQHLSALGLETELMSTRFEISQCPVAFQISYDADFSFLVQMHINLVRTDANTQRNMKKLSKERVMAS